MRKYDISDNAFTINTKEKRKCKKSKTDFRAILKKNELRRRASRYPPHDSLRVFFYYF